MSIVDLRSRRHYSCPGGRRRKKYFYKYGILPAQQRFRQLERCARALPVAQPRNAIELIEQALVYKFPGRPWRELEAMFGLTEWKQTRFSQEVKA